jgi:branched-chain amino acid transport system substrate-binding protein
MGQKTKVMLALLISVLAMQWLPGKAGQEGSAGKPIKIGLITSLSGAAADGGPDMVSGFKLYLDQIHNKIAGREVQLSVENDQSSRVTGMERARALIEREHVDVLVGIIGSHIAYQVAPLAAQAHVPLLLPATHADDLTLRKHSDFVLRLSVSSSQSSFPFGEYAKKTLKYNRIATVGTDFALAYEAVGAFQQTFEEAGGRIVQKIWIPLGFRDFHEYIKQIRPDIDAIYLVTPSGAGEFFPKQLKAERPNVPLIGAGPSFTQDVLRHVGDEVVGAISSEIYSSTLNNANNEKFVKAYVAKFDQIPSHLAEGSYVCAMDIDRAVTSLHGKIDDKAKFLAALRTADLRDAPRGPIVIDSYDNPVENVYVFKVEKVNGHLSNVPIHTFPKVSQFWKYKPSEVLDRPPFSRDYPPCRYCSKPE